MIASMQPMLEQLRACADPTRLRLLALCARGAFCVVEFTTILGQSQPRLSRHLRLLVQAGLLECSREGAHAWFSLAPFTLADDLLARLPTAPILDADARAAAPVLAERQRTASDSFHRQGADWDEMRALGLPAAEVEQALLTLLDIPRATPGPRASLGVVLDLGTGTGRLLELLSPYATSCLGIDASPAMLALARIRLSRPEPSQPQPHTCRVRRDDAYRLALPPGSQDLVLAQMLLHHAEDPAAILAEAARVLRPAGRLVVIDLAADPAVASHRFRWPGFSDASMDQLLQAAGLIPASPVTITGPGQLAIRLWPATHAAHAPTRALATLDA